MPILFDAALAEARLGHVDLPEGAEEYVQKLMNMAVAFCRTVSITMEVITPAVAEDILERYGSIQRNVRKTGVKKIKAQQELDRWDPFNGATIKFNQDGKLIDGHHRLLAVIKTGIPMPFMIITGLGEKAEMTLDQNIRRTPADLATLGGYAKYQSTIMASARLVDNYLCGTVFGEHMGVSADMLLDLVKKEWPDLVKSAEHVHTSGVYKYPRPSISATVHYLIGMHDVALRDDFFNDFNNPAGLVTENAAWLLRERLTEMRGNKYRGKALNNVLFSLWVAAWENWRRGKTPKRLQGKTKYGPYRRFSHLREPTREYKRRW